jgi:hypothetical protein
MKFSLYHSFPVTVCALGILGLLFSCLEMRVSFESTNPEASSSQAIKTPISQQTNLTPTPHAEVMSASTSNPTPNLINLKSTPPNLLAERFESADPKKHRGGLRVSNQTNEPLRLALLARQSTAQNKDSVASKTPYDIPAHWDFAPQEGSLKGLILSLPQGNLRLDKGDILVAFAQDGSRRYWGPYVVGETSSPVWNGKSQEWQLVLEP